MSICVMSICAHSYPERNLHTTSCQTRTPARPQHKIFASPSGTATPNAINTQQATKPACQEDINAKFSHLLLAQLPRMQFTHSKPPNPHVRKTSTRKSSGRAAVPKTRQSVHQTPRKCFKSHAGHAKAAETRQSVHQTPRKCSKPHACHAKAAAERRSPKRAKAYMRPRANAPSPTPATQKQRQSGGAQNAPKRTSDPVQVLQAPRLPRKSSGRAAEPKTRQSVHQTPRKCSKSHTCHAKAAAEQRSPKRAKAYIRPRASAPSPTPATQKQRQSRGAQNAPKRTSDPAQALQVPRLPRKSSGRAAEPKRRQSVHQTLRKCSKSHACHAKAAAEPRSPKRAKAYIRPHASAPNPTPATQKQRQSGGAQNAPKRTSDPVQVLQVPRLPRKSSGRAAEPKTRQSVHQTPCKCSKSHACHAKAAAEQRRPRSAKAYIRPPAGAPSPTPATRTQGQSSGDQGAPKRTSDPLQCTLCDVKLCDVKLCDVKLCDVKLCDVKLCDVKLCDVKLCDVNLRDIKLCDVKLCDVKLCDVKLCDVKLCDVKLCDVKQCDVKQCDVKLCDVNLCDVKLCDVKLCDVKLLCV